MTTTASLLVELFTEELPPTALKKLGQAFADLLSEELRAQGHLSGDSQITPLASPRRLACHITHVLGKSPDKEETTRLLPASIGLDDQGKPTAPLIKKLGSMGLTEADVSKLETIHDGKQDMLHITRNIEGKALESTMAQALQTATTKLPIPKVMSYQRPDGDTVLFVRPAHKLTVLHGEQVVPAQVLGLEADRITLGHRFLSTGVVNIASADSYEEQLEQEGKVIASFEKRRQLILDQLAALTKGDQVIQPDDLVDEVTALVEWPVTYEAYFEKEFLSVPQECLILTMQANQKYFAITDAQGRMTHRFLLVSNLATNTPELIINGNERVLRARLADAKFFFDQDRKRTLESRLPGLANVVYHNKLGSQHERNVRLVALAGWLASACAAEQKTAERAALLCKADLLTEMVGEFPELQGNMGEHYARHDGENVEVAEAIADHYSPRFAGDELPRNAAGLACALADKLETLVGIYGIGLIPTGDKDPFALRRHALGIIRMAIEKSLGLDVYSALKHCATLFGNYKDFSDPTDQVYGFILDRLRGYLRDQQYTANEIESVLSLNPTELTDLIPRLEAVRSFAKLPESEALASSNKRISNILKKTDHSGVQVKAELLHEDAEKNLFNAVNSVKDDAQAAYGKGNFQQALALMAPLKPQVDAFFDGVMVMAPEEDLKNNRIALLRSLHQMMNRVADISQLAS
ncbi:MAG: glycine--tRNA ligase subunit beta [Limnobacter sp.]|nr:glycine--tRNA ligase subunit beta [Limnobacter sp.]